MKILYLTGGAGQMYCGSCLRDNALAAELIARGHDVTLLPVYTPTRTDEPNVSYDRVFFSGVSVYLEQHVPLFRATPRWLDRLWDSGPLLRLATHRSISTSPKLLGELTVSMLKGEDGFQRKEIVKLLAWLKQQPTPDVVSLPYSLLIALARPLKQALQRPVCCTLQGEDLFLEGLPEPYRSEALSLIRANVEHVDAFLAVSDYYAHFMADYLEIPAARIHVVPLGINFQGYEMRARERSQPFTVGFFARIAPEKGLHVLVETYKRLRDKELHGARLEVAGYLAPEHKEYLRDCEQRLKAYGLRDEYSYRGVLDREQKIEFLQKLDVLSVPAVYEEPKGIFLLEAMGCGVPLVQPRCGAFPEIIAKTKGGLVVENNPESLAAGIMKLCRDPELAATLGQNAFHNVRQYYNVGNMAEQALGVYENLLQNKPQLKVVAANQGEQT